MMASEDLRRALQSTLIALADHADSLAEADYAAGHDALGGSSIGMHVRHCLDHFETLCVGLEDGRLDYDDRAREARCERDPGVAAARARRLSAELGDRLVDVDPHRALQVRMAAAIDGQVAWHASSVGRELQFLISHTVHHTAMIAASCRARGLAAAGAHGVAPSTLRYRRGGGARPPG